MRSLQEKIFIVMKKKNRYNNIKVIAIVDTMCCKKIWGNRFV